jgi:hypothetical protein
MFTEDEIRTVLSDASTTFNEKMEILRQAKQDDTPLMDYPCYHNFVNKYYFDCVRFIRPLQVFHALGI